MNAAGPGVRTRLWALVLWAMGSAPGCVEFTPFDSQLNEDEKDQTARNLAMLAASAPPAGDWRFAVIADSHERFDALCDLVDRLNETKDLSFVVHLGDFSNVGLRREYQWTLRCLRRLSAPVFVVIGNHDAISNGKAVYSSMFGAYDFTIDYGTVRLACFNSNELEFENVPDLDWLDAATSPTGEFSRILAATHQPSRGRAYADLLRRNGVEAVLSSHIHGFEIVNDGGLLAVSVDDAATGHFSIVTVRRQGLDVEECSTGGCVTRRP